MPIFSWQPWPPQKKTPPSLLHTHTHHHQRMRSRSRECDGDNLFRFDAVQNIIITHAHTHTQRETIEKPASRTTTTAPPAFTCSQRTKDTGVRRRQQRPCRRRHRRCRLYMMSLVFAMGGHADGGVWERYIFLCWGIDGVVSAESCRRPPLTPTPTEQRTVSLHVCRRVCATILLHIAHVRNQPSPQAFSHGSCSPPSPVL